MPVWRPRLKWSALPDYGELMTQEAWFAAVDHRAFIPYDGSGYWATTDRMSNWSVWEVKRPKWATHVMWFNK